MGSAIDTTSFHVERELPEALGGPMMLFNSGFSTFSNFYLCPFTVNGIHYKTTEQYYQSEKADYFGDYIKAAQIRSEARPSKCKRLGGEIRNFDKDIWEGVARTVMLRGVYAKFRQNYVARQKLLDTGDALLVEATPYDTYWGSGLHISDNDHKDQEKWRGSNHLGTILMTVRENIKKEYRDCDIDV